MSRLALDALAILLLAACGLVVIDLWRGGSRWQAIMLSLACWVILLIAVEEVLPIH